MKKFKRLCVCVLTAMAALTFTGCLDSDPGMTLHVSGYIRQVENGYRPYIIAQSATEIERAYFPFYGGVTDMERIYAHAWGYEDFTDTPSASYSVTALSPTGGSAVSTVVMDFGSKKLGEIRLDTFAYDATTHNLVAEWSKVDSANYYCLMFCLEQENALYDAFPRSYYTYINWGGTTDGQNFQGSCNLVNTVKSLFGKTLEAGDRLKVAVVAGYRNSAGYLLLRESDPVVVTIGTSQDFLD